MSGPFLRLDHLQLAIPAGAPATKAHPAFRCADYDGLLKRFASRSVVVVHGEPPFDGKRHCYVLDPFGNRIELIAN
jgi:catechol 2,3-dioxygenase-like lactoylglutathione lyase family enzyme